MRAAPVAQKNRMTTAAAATTAVTVKVRAVAVFVASAANSPVTAVIRTMLAARETHCSATFPAMYFLLSLTVLISRLLIIIPVSPVDF
jgi:hypothetical protein